MKVYQVRHDSNAYQSFLPASEDAWKGDNLLFNCTPKARSWRAPPVYLHNPVLPPGDFIGFGTGALTMAGRTIDLMREFLEMAGEILPLPFNGHEYGILNITDCVNCLDDVRSEWVLGKDTGKRIRIERYVFFPDRFSESTLFKIPETRRGQLLTVEGVADPEQEFKPTVEKLGLTGLKFEPLWSS